jgi:uncharacterized protein YdaU (DUF1376 family)
MGKAPAFQLYAADFYMDTASWEVDTVGLYFRLLIYQWVNGSIPNDMEKIARIGGCINNRKWRTNVARMWREQEHKWVTVPGTNELINLRLEASRQEQDNFRKSQQESGKRGAEKRWGKRSDPNGEPISDPNGETVALQSSSSSSSSEKIIKGYTDKNIQKSEPLETKTEERKPYVMPDKEDVTESSDRRINDLITEACNEIISREIYPKVFSYVQQQKNLHMNLRSILHALMNMIEASEKMKIESPRAYLDSIIKVEHGNYNAQEYYKQNVQ